MEWISVNDRLPEWGKKVIIYTNKNGGLMGIGEILNYESTKWWHTEFYGYIEDSFEPTYWMPFPKFPKTN